MNWNLECLVSLMPLPQPHLSSAQLDPVAVAAVRSAVASSRFLQPFVELPLLVDYPVDQPAAFDQAETALPANQDSAMSHLMLLQGG